MVPDKFINFLLGSTGASAALIGLLFVAIQIAPAHTVGHTAPIERRATTESAFAALANAFFISLGGLVPDVNIGKVTLVAGIIALVGTLRLGGDYLRAHPDRQGRAGAALLLLASFVVYAFELVYAVQLIRTPSDVGPLSNLPYVLLAVYSLGLGRAWSLVRGQNEGILHRLLGPRNVDIPVPAGGGFAPTDPADARDASASSPAPDSGTQAWQV